MWNATPGDAWRSNGAAIQPFIQLVFQHLETPQPSECPQVIAKSAPLGRLVGEVNSQGLQGKLHLHLAKPQKSIDAVLSNPILKWWSIYRIWYIYIMVSFHVGINHWWWVLAQKNPKNIWSFGCRSWLLGYRSWLVGQSPTKILQYP